TTAACGDNQPVYRTTKSIYQFEDNDTTVIASGPAYIVTNSIGAVVTGNLPAGLYTVTPSGITQLPSPPNYNIVYENGTLTVTGSAAPIVTVVDYCDSSVLTTNAPGALAWSTGATTSSITVTQTGVYTVTSTVGTCMSPAGSGTAAPKPAPDAPTITVTQPTCTTTTGTINVTSTKTGLTFSIINGNYISSNTTGTFNNVAAGTYQLTATNATGCVSTAVSVVITPGGCATIGDLVFIDKNGNGIQDALNNEGGLAGVTVKLLNNTGVVLSTTTTAANGTYSFKNVAPGSYKVNFTTPADYIATKSNMGSDDAKDSDPVNGTTATFTISGSTVNNSVDAGFISTILELGNKVWYD
ncbi:MAG: hypothetical protein EOP51_34280, partial [Sphingobacteriales bacterium]